MVFVFLNDMLYRNWCFMFVKIYYFFFDGIYDLYLMDLVFLVKIIRKIFGFVVGVNCISFEKGGCCIVLFILRCVILFCKFFEWFLFVWFYVLMVDVLLRGFKKLVEW